MHISSDALRNHCSGKEPAGFSRRYAKGAYSRERVNPCLRASAVGPTVLPILQMRKLSLEKPSHLTKGSQLINDDVSAWPWHFLLPVPNPCSTCVPCSLVLGAKSTDRALTWPLPQEGPEQRGDRSLWSPNTGSVACFLIGCSRCPGLIPLQGVGDPKAGDGWTQGLRRGVLTSVTNRRWRGGRAPESRPKRGSPGSSQKSQGCVQAEGLRG